ncbi:TonB-dependent receptor [Lysobacter niabensis]|uniref:TonB-dependent receptor n=1 Tax=Agrilutibacter niabensis TaxID=380628 RepID=UPI00360C13F2
MKSLRPKTLAKAIQLSLLLSLPVVAAAQDQPAPAAPEQRATTLDTVTVTGSRIKQANLVTAQPVFILDRQKLEKTGVQTVGEVLQQLTASGQALNAKFNSSGNFGYPSDGGGIGAGSAQVDLRNLGSKRVLVLVDGIRWVNESSASGVSGSADVNTIPLAIVERIEVLEDGASAIYGSDAIAGVINIITRRNFEGAEAHAYYGEYEDGGGTTEMSMTLGGGGERFNAVFGASYYEQKSISSGSWEQSSFPTPGTGVRGGSSGTPQGRATFCDPSIADPTQYGFCDPAGEMWFDVTLNNGTTTPSWDPNNPTGGTYHNFSGADRFNFAPYNLLLTPSKRKALFTSLNYDLTDNVRLHAKALYNNRTSTNQAAPEPIFVGPFAGTGGIADTIIVHADNPYNPFGITLDPATNFGWVTRRPVEVGPRIFNQDVDTIYFNLGLDGTLDAGDRTYGWDVNAVHSENKAEQHFFNGYNVAKLKLALGDPAVCALVAGCVPLDLFGGQGRPMTQEMIDYIRTEQIDSSKQTLDLFSANITGDLFNIADRTAGFAAGFEHRKYKGEFNPDPLRQTGESQDSFAAAVSAEYDVDELYAEANFPVLSTLEISAALRYSDYSTFGDATTGKVGFRWQPVEDFVFRGTYSEGFRAPNLGELYGLTQFGATIVDPCGSTGNPGPADPSFAAGCAAQGAPPTFEQANTQITTFTGGNPNLEPEESDSYTFGMVYSPSWAEGMSWSDKLDFELGYYHHEIDGAIQPRDIQALLEACLREGGVGTPSCAPFSRQPSGNLNPPENFLDNLATIETDGVDIKVNWIGPEWSWGRLTAGLQSTYVNDYEAVDIDGNKSQREVGIEVNDGAIPEWQTNVQLGWVMGDWDVSWTTRYISSVDELCSNVPVPEAPGCMGGVEFNTLGSTTYNDLRAGWKDAFTLEGLKLSVGVNNIFGKEPPVCLTCSLNGYDASTYDLPGAFWYVSADYRF